MKLAVISDIHGNIHALKAVWEDIETQQLDAVYCLGDLVGYGAFPNEVIDFIRGHGIPTVMGNYDEGVGFDMDNCGCVYKDPQDETRGKQSLMWSRENTTLENKSYLRELPLQIRLDDQAPEVLLVHGSPRKINEYLYQDRADATFGRLAEIADVQILLFGHTHIPYRKKVEATWFVNTGSVGKPKDGDPRGGYVVADLGSKPSFTYRRVAYDIPAAAAAIRDSGLPNEYASMLETGTAGAG